MSKTSASTPKPPSQQAPTAAPRSDKRYQNEDLQTSRAPNRKQEPVPVKPGHRRRADDPLH